MSIDSINFWCALTMISREYLSFMNIFLCQTFNRLVLKQRPFSDDIEHEEDQLLTETQGGINIGLYIALKLIEDQRLVECWAIFFYENYIRSEAC